MVDFVNFIEKLINVTEIVNKWQMWSESELPDQSVYVPSIFQMRDAYSHLVRFFGIALSQETFIENNGIVSFAISEEVEHQIREALGHACRAFYDCADNILISINEEINKNSAEDPLQTFNFRIRLLKYMDKITDLRKAKSESIENSYHNIIEWDLVLQTITTIYRFSSIESTLGRSYKMLCDIAKDIELTHDSDIIKNHCPQFYESIKKDIFKLKEIPPEYLMYADEDINLYTEILENPVVWQDRIVTLCKSRQSKIEELINELLFVNQAMLVSTNVRKKNGFKSFFVKFAQPVFSGVISYTATFIFGQYFFIPTALVSAPQPKAVDYSFLFRYILIFVLFFVLIFVICNILSRLFIKKYKP